MMSDAPFFCTSTSGSDSSSPCTLFMARSYSSSCSAPLLVDGLTMEWFNQSDGSSLEKRSGTSIPVLSDGRRRLFIDHKPQMTSDLIEETTPVKSHSHQRTCSLLFNGMGGDLVNYIFLVEL